MDSPLSPGVVARGIKKGRPPGTANGFDLGRKIGSLNRDGKASKAERKEQKRQCAIKRRNALLRLKHKELVAENDQLKKRHKPDINDCCQVLLATQGIEPLFRLDYLCNKLYSRGHYHGQAH